MADDKIPSADMLSSVPPSVFTSGFAQQPPQFDMLASVPAVMLASIPPKAPAEMLASIPPANMLASIPPAAMLAPVLQPTSGLYPEPTPGFNSVGPELTQTDSSVEESKPRSSLTPSMASFIAPSAIREVGSALGNWTSVPELAPTTPAPTLSETTATSEPLAIPESDLRQRKIVPRVCLVKTTEEWNESGQAALHGEGGGGIAIRSNNVGKQVRNQEITGKQHQLREIRELNARITQLEDDERKRSKVEQQRFEEMKRFYEERETDNQKRFQELQQLFNQAKQKSEMELQRLQEKNLLVLTAKNKELMELEAHITTLEEESANNLKIFCDERALEQKIFRDLQHHTNHMMSHVEQGEGGMWCNILPENNNCQQLQLRIVFEDQPSFDEIVCAFCPLQMLFLACLLFLTGWLVVKLIISRKFGTEPAQQLIFIVGSGNNNSEELLMDSSITLDDIQKRQQGNSTSRAVVQIKGCDVEPGTLELLLQPVTSVDTLTSMIIAKLVIPNAFQELADVIQGGWSSPYVAGVLARCDGAWPTPSGKDFNGMAALFMFVFSEAIKAIPGGKFVHYFTPLKMTSSDKEDLPLVTEMAGANGIPVPRDSVDLDSLDLGWLPKLQAAKLSVKDFRYKYDDVRNEFVDIIEAFYLTLALALEGRVLSVPEPESPLKTSATSTVQQQPARPSKLAPKPPTIINNAPRISLQMETIQRAMAELAQEEEEEEEDLRKCKAAENTQQTTEPHSITTASAEGSTHSTTVTSTEQQPPLLEQLQPFLIQTADVDQVCSWLGSVGADDDCLKSIRVNKLRGRTLANCTKEQLCNLGFAFGDAAFVVEEVQSHLESQRQPQQISTDIEATKDMQPQLMGARSLCEMNYKCFAFIVGNEAYGQFSLRNTINDADSVSKFLRTTCRFEVVCQKNIPNLQEFATNLELFKSTLKEQKKAGNKVASVFYFAGHGRQLKGHNFLLMTATESAFTETKFDLLKYNTPMLGAVLDGIQKHSDLTIGILDACREADPNDSDEFRTRGFGPTGQRLTKEDFPAGCIVIYPTSPGKTTLYACKLPNRRNNGFFTGCFLEGATEITKNQGKVKRKAVLHPALWANEQGTNQQESFAETKCIVSRQEQT
ncbi:hypothetical protein Pelo_9683 [Pelomyxa schiedti]|nr:hypothetical protein Pelo_9683 [Pelomyxa schiedti]